MFCKRIYSCRSCSSFFICRNIVISSARFSSPEKYFVRVSSIQCDALYIIRMKAKKPPKELKKKKKQEGDVLFESIFQFPMGDGHLALYRVQGDVELCCDRFLLLPLNLVHHKDLPALPGQRFNRFLYDRLDVRFRKDLIIKCLQRLQFHLQLDVVIISHLLCAFSDYRFVPQQIEASVLRSGKQPGEQAGVRHQNKLLLPQFEEYILHDVLRIFFTNEVFSGEALHSQVV